MNYNYTLPLLLNFDLPRHKGSHKEICASKIIQILEANPILLRNTQMRTLHFHPPIICMEKKQKLKIMQVTGLRCNL
jgi:hypothetical protein